MYEFQYMLYVVLLYLSTLFVDYLYMFLYFIYRYVLYMFIKCCGGGFTIIDLFTHTPSSTTPGTGRLRRTEEEE